ncbi:MAG: rod shape-determining protein MreD [Silicimonas sp.]|nr:rod shape-determining protein MreD [Silicimonas sp.]
MADRPRNIWSYRGTFIFLVAAVGFVQLLPLHPGPGGMPGPDIILLIALSWVVMRPDFVPVMLLAAVFLIADLLFMRPPGLWTALAILGTEFLRGRHVQLRAASFFTEWLLIAGLITGMTLVNGLVLLIFGVDQASVGLTIIRLIFSILAYPIVVILAGRAFGVRKVRAGDNDQRGVRV